MSDLCELQRELAGASHSLFQILDDYLERLQSPSEGGKLKDLYISRRTNPETGDLVFEMSARLLPQHIDIAVSLSIDSI